MREMKDSGVPWIGKIPLKWNVHRNKDGFINTKTIVGEHSKNTPLLSLTTKGIKLKDIDNPEGKQPESFDTYQCVEINDLVMCLFDLDISAVFSGLSSYDGMISPAYKVLKCNKRVIAKYADYWFRYIFDGRKFNQYAKNIRYTLTYDVFSALPMLYPSVEEQQNIADYLDTKCTQIDTIIAREQSVIEKLQEYNRAIISEAVTKGINSDREVIDSGVQWIGRIPNSWKIIKLKYEADIRRGRFSHRPRNDPDYYDGKYPFIQTGDITASKKYITSYTQTLNERGLKVSTSFPKDTICMSIAANIGDVAILSFDACFPDSIVGIGSKKIEINYLYYALKNMKERLLSVATISTQQNINVEILNDEFIALPPVDEQKQISNYLDRKSKAIDRIVYQKKYLIDKLNEYKKSLIYEVVTGKKEVPYV